MNCPNIRQSTQETPYRAIPSANKSSIIRPEGGWCCKELANELYLAGLFLPGPYIGVMTASSVPGGLCNLDPSSAVIDHLINV
jgi:hypothetical protein